MKLDLGEKAWNLQRQGNTKTKIAELLGVKTTYVTDALYAYRMLAGVGSGAGRNLKQQTFKACQKDFESGLSVSEIAARNGVTVRTVQRFIGLFKIQATKKKSAVDGKPTLDTHGDLFYRLIYGDRRKFKGAHHGGLRSADIAKIYGYALDDVRAVILAKHKALGWVR
jgi:transposase